MGSRSGVGDAVAQGGSTSVRKSSDVSWAGGSVLLGAYSERTGVMTAPVRLEARHNYFVSINLSWFGGARRHRPRAPSL